MSDESVVALAKVIADFLAALLWPGVFFLALVYLRDELRAFIRNVGELSFKAGGVEATAKRQVEAAALLGAAEAAKAEPAAEGAPPAPTPEGRARSIAATVRSAVRPRALAQLSAATVLWVDDRPSNNTYERRALEAIGIRFAEATSTEEALQRLSTETFDAVISDLGRPGDSNAGLTLLEEVRNHGLKLPVIIYAGQAAVKRRDEILRRGAYGSTNSPQELFQLVTSALRSQGRAIQSPGA